MIKPAAKSIKTNVKNVKSLRTTTTEPQQDAMEAWKRRKNYDPMAAAGLCLSDIFFFTFMNGLWLKGRVVINVHSLMMVLLAIYKHLTSIYTGYLKKDFAINSFIVCRSKEEFGVDP